VAGNELTIFVMITLKHLKVNEQNIVNVKAFGVRG
jgi:hypothetical protein